MLYEVITDIETAIIGFYIPFMGVNLGNNLMAFFVFAKFNKGILQLLNPFRAHIRTDTDRIVRNRLCKSKDTSIFKYGRIVFFHCVTRILEDCGCIHIAVQYSKYALVMTFNGNGFYVLQWVKSCVV